CYGWGVWDTVYASDKEAMDWKANIQKELKEVGIEELGMISHQEVAKLYKRATILAYPSEFAEIDCISVSKALASGCIPVTTNFAAMGEKSTYGGVYIESKKTKDTWCRDGQISFSMESNMDKWIKETVKILKGDKPKLKRDKVLKDFNWDNITERWNKTIC
ncbi:MAG: glycosyltransferase, partial [Deltaproteobacteria bacterium]|nr:glycosyltransferase [Deltaproteobacteria bacterium]